MSDAKLLITLVAFAEYTRGMLADRAINRLEAQALRDRLNATPALQQVPVMRQIWDTIATALADDHIDEQESDALVALLGEFVDAAPEDVLASTRYTPPAGPTGEFIEKLKEGDEYQIVYTGSDGKPGERNVVLRQVRVKDGVHSLACYCLKAQAARTFIAARVSRAIHVPTGEILL